MPIAQPVIDALLRTPYGERAYRIVEKLTEAGYDAYWVGGSVRDMLQERIPTDIDIATSAVPDEMRAVFPAAIETPRSLGSLRVQRGGDVFEVTTFREESDLSDGRIPASIRFSTKERDAERRDFTVNALYYQPVSRELFDPFGGEADLRELLIRFIGDPVDRIRHDALRILRAVRFRAMVNGQYHPDTFRALHAEAGLVKHLSGQRVLEELEKILKNPHPDRALEDLWELDILSVVLPELHACKGVPQPSEYHKEGDVWEHTLACTRAFGEEDSRDVRLATLFHDCGKAETFSLRERIRFDHHASVSADLAAGALKRLGMSAKRIVRIRWLIAHHMMMGAFFDMNDESKAKWYHHEWFTDLLRVFRLDIAGTEPADYSLLEKIEKDYHAFLNAHPRPKPPLLTGEEIMRILNLQPGERVGRILDLVRAAQVRGEIHTKEDARQFVSGLGS